MRYAMLGALILVSGCVNPVGPTTYTCYTQPRQYVNPDGTKQYEIDHYDQSTPCPKRRIE